MSDITKCYGKGCPIKDTCYRYLAVGNPFRQAYWVGEVYKDGKCDYHMKVYVVDDAEPPPPDSGFVKL